MNKSGLKAGFIVVVLLIAISFSTQAQMFRKGDKDLSPGVGFGATWYSGYYWRTTIPTLSVSYDYGFRDDVGPGVIGIGGYLGYSGYKTSWYGADYGWKYSSLMIGAMGTYHMTFVDNLDTYAGLILGYRAETHKEYNTVPIGAVPITHSGIAGALIAGAKYYLSDNFAVKAELGFGITWLTIGMNFKLY